MSAALTMFGVIVFIALVSRPRRDRHSFERRMAMKERNRKRGDS